MQDAVAVKETTGRTQASGGVHIVTAACELGALGQGPHLARPCYLPRNQTETISLDSQNITNRGSSIKFPYSPPCSQTKSDHSLTHMPVLLRIAGSIHQGLQGIFRPPALEEEMPNPSPVQRAGWKWRYPDCPLSCSPTTGLP